MTDFNSFFKDFGSKITDSFAKEWKFLRNDIIKQLKLSDFSGKKTKLFGGDTSSLASFPFQSDFDAMKSQIEYYEKIQQLKQRINTDIKDTDRQKEAMSIANSYNEALSSAEKLSANTKDLENIFNSAVDKMINGTEDFKDVMKNMFDELRQYFIKAVLDAVMNRLISENAGESIAGALSGLGGSGKNVIGAGISGIFGIIGKLFGSHHSGGYIPSGTGTLPGTSEYLSVLKGGERVLSPSENSALNNGQNPNNVVVNNFNIQSWDSKDVQQYLLSNKSLIAKITAENIKYNNSNLRYMVGNY